MKYYNNSLAWYKEYSFALWCYTKRVLGKKNVVSIITAKCCMVVCRHSKACGITFILAEIRMELVEYKKLEEMPNFTAYICLTTKVS
jgi:hypothetical protein